jgi:ribosomal-protein-alanine N-acetyltransferase
MQFEFRPLDAEAVYQLVTWRYEAPYDMYNISDDVEPNILALLMISCNSYYRIDDPERGLIAFCCFGDEGRVAGGDYSQEALDLGLGVHPDLTGQGLGHLFIDALCNYAQNRFQPQTLRVTIAAWNGRAQRVWTKAGFQERDRFKASRNGMEFIIFTRSNTKSV